MTPTNKRNLMLATSGLVGLAGLASMTLGVNEAQAACVLTSGVLVCDGDDTSTNVNTAITGEAGPDLKVRINSGTIDLSTGDIIVSPAKFTGAVVFTNGSTIGKADVDGYAVDTKAVSLTGDLTKSTNSLTYINDGALYSSVELKNSGGASTITLNDNVVGTALGAGGSVGIIDSLGDATVTSASGVAITGGVSVDAIVATAVTSKTVSGVKTDTTDATGGAATVTLGGSVGQSTTPGTFNPNNGQPDPTVFTGAAVTVVAADDATLTIDSGTGSTAVVGKVKLESTWSKNVVVTDQTTVATVVTDTVTTTNTGGGGVASFTLGNGAAQGEVKVFGDGGNVVTTAAGSSIGDTASKTVSNLTVLSDNQVTNGAQAIDVKTAGILTKDFDSTTSTTGGNGPSSVTLGGTVTGDVFVQGAGVTADLKGTVGIGTTTKSTVTLVATGVKTDDVVKDTTFDAATGAITLGTYTSKTVTNQKYDGALTYGTGANIVGGTTLQAGGDLTVTSTGGRTASLTVQNTGNVDTFTSTRDENDATGVLVTETVLGTQTSTGGAATLTLGGNVGSSATSSATPGAVTVAADGGITVDVTALVIGNTTLTSSSDNFDTSLITKVVAGGTDSTQVNTQAAGGGAVSMTIAKTSTVGDQAGTAVSIVADQDVALTNDGKIRGAVVIDTQRSLLTVDNAALKTVVTTTGEDTSTEITTTSTQTTSTVGGQVKMANNSLNSLIGSVTINAAGPIAYANPGLVTGDVTLVSSGATSTTDVNDKTGTLSQPTVPGKGLTEGEILTTDVDNTTTTTTTVTGGSVTGTYSGIVGLDNKTGTASIDNTAGTLISQAADTDSTLTVSGTAFEGVSSTAGAYSTSSVATKVSTKTTTSDILNPGKLVLMTAATGTASVTSDTSSTSNGGTSTVTISGALNAPLAGGASGVTSVAQGKSTVTVAGKVAGPISSTSSALNTTTTSKTDSTYGFKAASSSAKASVTTTTTLTESTTTNTLAGGASLVDISGAGSAASPTVNGGISSAGNTTSTVNIGAKSYVGGISSVVNGFDSSTTSKSTPSATSVVTVTQQVAATSGLASVKTDGIVNGGITAQGMSGGATVTANNFVNGSILADSAGLNSGGNAVNSKTSSASTKAIITLSSNSTTDDVGVGGAAKVDLTAPAAFVSGNKELVNGNVTANGGTSGTVNVGAGAIVDGSVTANAYNINNKSKLTNTHSIALLGAITGTSKTETEAYVGGAATVTNAGTADALFANGGVATVTNSGTTGHVEAYGLIEDLNTLTVKTNLNVPLNQSTTVTETYTPQTTSKATVTNNNLVFGDIYVAGAVGTVNNATTAAAESISAGDSVNNFVLTTTTTPTSTSTSVAVNKTLFSQVYTLNQNGVVSDGFDIFGGVVGDPTGAAPYLVTSDVKTAVNLNAGSTTTGDIASEWEATGTPLNPAAPGAYLVNTTVNLNGTGFLGWDGVANAKSSNDLNIFVAAPTMTKDQEAFMSQGAGTITAATAVNHTGPGTFYILGRDYRNFGTTTATRLDDAYSIRTKTFTNTSGRLEFANDGGDDAIFGVSGNTVNSGEFVLGHTEVFVPQPNLSSLLDTQTFVDGENFLFTGNFTQTASGTLIVGGTPALFRGGTADAFGVGTDGALEPLGFFQSGVSADPFTIAEDLGDNSFATVEGDLNLAGKIVIANHRGSLTAAGTSTPLFRVTGTVTNTATVTPSFASNFVTYELASTKSGTDTLLGISSNRTQYGTVAANTNALAAADALNSDLPTVIQRITDDANGMPVFSTVLDFNQVQDLANTAAGLDWVLGLPDVPLALNELSSGDIYASLNVASQTAQFSNAMMNEGWGLMEGEGRIALTPAYRTTTIDGDTHTGAGEIQSNEAGLFFTGAFQATESWGWGIGAGYQGAEVDGEDKPYSAEVNTYLLGANVHWNSGAISLRGGVEYGASNIEARRRLTIFSRDITADYDSHDLVVDLMGAYTFEDVMGGSLSPYLHVGIRNISTDGFTESTSGGGIALVVDKFSDTQTTPEIGVHWMRQGVNMGIGTFDPFLDASIIFNDAANESVQRFAGGTTPFTIRGVDPSTSGQITGGVTGGLGDMGSYSFSATGMLGDVAGVGANATLRFHF